MTFDLFAHGPDRRTLWLAIARRHGHRGRAGGCPASNPHRILRFNEDRPNPLRRVCYTLAWSEVVSYALLNVVGLVDAIVNGTWRARAIYDVGYLPIAVTIWLLGAFGWLPRVKKSTQGEGHERRYFYGSVWAVCIAQPALWFMWKALPPGRTFDIIKLLVFLGILAAVADYSRRGRLPRTRPILPGELAVD